MLYSGFSMTENVAEMWWFSRGDLSLYSIAHGALDSTRKKLLKPGCSKSWQLALIRIEANSRSLTFPIVRKSHPFRKKYEVCHTSVPCVLLWYSIQDGL